MQMRHVAIVALLVCAAFLAGVFVERRFARQAQDDRPASIDELYDRVRKLEDAEKLEWRLKRLEERRVKGTPPFPY